MSTRSVRFYIDGVLFADTKDQSPYGGTLVLNSATVGDLFNGATVIPHSWTARTMKDVAGSMAQLRFYDRVLSPDEIETLHTASMWPSGKVIKQCKTGRTDMEFADTLRTDSQGNPCSWWFSVSQDFPWVCSAAWLKEMCPVTCSGVRLCHDGTLNQGDTMNDVIVTPPRRKFRIFDRIMHLRPKIGQTGLLCPSDRLNKEELLAQCRANAQTPNFYDTQQWNFTCLLYTSDAADDM
eukprot:2135174-Rhodomonas_salina.1